MTSLFRKRQASKTNGTESTEIRFLIGPLVLFLLAGTAVGQSSGRRWVVTVRDQFNFLHDAENEAELLQLHDQFNTPRGKLTIISNVVTKQDFFWATENYGQEVDGYLYGDLNIDGHVDLQDIAILSYNFNKTQFAANPAPYASDA